MIYNDSGDNDCKRITLWWWWQCDNDDNNSMMTMTSTAVTQSSYWVELGAWERQFFISQFQVVILWNLLSPLTRRKKGLSLSQCPFFVKETMSSFANTLALLILDLWEYCTYNVHLGRYLREYCKYTFTQVVQRAVIDIQVQNIIRRSWSHVQGRFNLLQQHVWSSLLHSKK